MAAGGGDVLGLLEANNADMVDAGAKPAAKPSGGTAFNVTMTGQATGIGAAAAAGAAGAGAAAAAAQPVKEEGKRAVRKGRGHVQKDDKAQRYEGKSGHFEALAESDESAAQQSIEGWIVAVTNVHDETQEDDIYELFAEHGDIKQIVLNLDRRTGYVKGYAFIEYESYAQAAAAIDACNGAELHEQKLTVDWAFKKPPKGGVRGAYRPGRGGARRPRA